MTIALGILASDGLVVAADSQESISGYMKVSQGKIALVDLGDRSMAIAGAGSGAYVDALVEDLAQAFLKFPKRGDLRTHLGKTVKAFFEASVIPFAAYPEHQQPEPSMLIAYQHGGYQGLLTTEKLAVRHTAGFGAIGSGELYAKALLTDWSPTQCWHSVPVAVAAVVAAYVIFRVKETIDGCGKATSLCCIRGSRACNPLTPEELARLEDAFVGWQRAQRASLYTLLGNPELSNVDPNKKAERAQATLQEMKETIEARLPPPPAQPPSPVMI